MRPRLCPAKRNHGRVVSRNSQLSSGALGIAICITFLAGCGSASQHSDLPSSDGLRPSRTETPQALPSAEDRASVAARLPRVPTLLRRPAQTPAFAIARLRAGARVAIWRAPQRGYLRLIGPRTEFGSPVVLSVVKRRGKWLGVSSADLGDGKIGWIRRNPRKVQLYWTEYSLAVSLVGRSLALRYGGHPVDRFPVTIGGPGSETPLGRFGITDALRFGNSPYYGCCALALSGRQPRLPPGWIGGNRLAIHGTHGAVGRAESSGCIRATDRTMRLLFRLVPLGTPVFVRE